MKSDGIRRLRISLSLLVALVLTASGVRAAEFYVAPNGSPSGSGSFANPWNLQTALNQPASVHPGDTIWLRGGHLHGQLHQLS